MGTNPRKRQVAQNGTTKERTGNQSSFTPLTNRGGNSEEGSEDGKHQAVSSRERLNLSLSPEVRESVRALASILGMSDAQLVSHALMQSFPELLKQAQVVLNLSKKD